MSRFQGTARERRALGTYIKLMRATETLNAGLIPAVQAAGLTGGQLAVLEALLHLGPMSQGELGRKLLRSNPNVTTVLDNLESAGLIARTRDTVDRRVTTVSLTAAGRRRIEDIFPAHARRIADALSVLTPEEQETLGALCRKLGLALAAKKPKGIGVRPRVRGVSTP